MSKIDRSLPTITKFDKRFTEAFALWFALTALCVTIVLIVG